MWLTRRPACFAWAFLAAGQTRACRAIPTRCGTDEEPGTNRATPWLLLGAPPATPLSPARTSGAMATNGRGCKQWRDIRNGCGSQGRSASHDPDAAAKVSAVRAPSLAAYRLRHEPAVGAPSPATCRETQAQGEETVIAIRILARLCYFAVAVTVAVLMGVILMIMWVLCMLAEWCRRIAG
jgi:hypothetical protein